MEQVDLTKIFESHPHLSTVLPSVRAIAASFYQYGTAISTQKSFEYVQQLKDVLGTSGSIEKVKTMCSTCPQECEQLCKEFYEYCVTNANNLENASVACSKLDDLYMKQVASIGTWMMANALLALGQSVKAWMAVYQFEIPDYQNELVEVVVYLERSASKLKPMLETNKADKDDLNKIDDWLLSAHNILERIRKDLEKKIIEAKKLRSDNFLSSVVNGVSIVANYLSYQALAANVADASFKALTVGSNLIHGACTIGDLIATGQANNLVSQLNNELTKVRNLQIQRQKFAAQVRTLH